jgi:hypothetical protein
MVKLSIPPKQTGHMDEDENTKNTFSFGREGLQNPAVVISTVAVEERCWRFPFF